MIQARIVTGFVSAVDFPVEAFYHKSIRFACFEKTPYLTAELFRLLLSLTLLHLRPAAFLMLYYVHKQRSLIHFLNTLFIPSRVWRKYGSMEEILWKSAEKIPV